MSLVKSLSSSEYLQIACIHKKMLKNSGFLSDCTIKFINNFYKQVHQFSSSIIIIDKLDNSDIITGFALLSTDSNNFFNKFIFKNLFLIIGNPINLFAFIKALMRKTIKKKLFLYNIELVHIAVDKDFQGKGIAKKIISELEAYLIKMNIKEYYLQVFDNNLIAKNLYIKNKFEILTSFKYGKRKKLLMKKNIAVCQNEK